jgi:hypothetical protein
LRASRLAGASTAAGHAFSVQTRAANERSWEGLTMKNSSTLLSIMGATFAVLCLTVSADAKKVGDWTCEDFLKASSSQKEKMVYFFQGIKLADKKDALDLAANDFNVPVSKVVQHCHKNPPENLWQAIIDHFYWRATQIP